MARPNKKQHTIPRIYLQAFANSSSVIWVADESLKIYQQKPENVLTERDYYTIRFKTGGGTLDIETKYLNGIEASYADIYREKIEKRLRITEEEKAKISVFVASMMQRQPVSRGSLERFFKDAERVITHMRGLPDKVKKQLASLPTSSSSESISAKELLEIGKDVGSLHSSLIPSTVDGIAPIIFDMKWSFVVRPKDSNPFIASNNPCVMVNPATENEIGRGKIGSMPGLIQKDVELTLPLSPDISLLCGWIIEKDCFYVPTYSEMVDEINRRTSRHARTLISSSKDMMEQRVESIKSHKKEGEEKNYI